MLGGGTHWHLIGLLALILLAFVASLLVRDPEYFHRSDQATIALPTYAQTMRCFLKGELPLVNHHQYSGTPHLATGHAGVLYPVAPLSVLIGFLVGRPELGLDLLMLVHLIFGGMGVFLLARDRGAPPYLAFLVGLTWSTTSFTIQLCRVWIVIAYAAAWIPWSQLLLERTLRQPSRRRVIALSLVKTAFLYMGYPQYAVLAACFDLLFLGFTWVFRRESIHPRGILAVSAAALLALGLSAVYLLPVWEHAGLSGGRRGMLPEKEILYASLTWNAFLRAQSMNFYEDFFYAATTSLFFVGPLLVAPLLLAGLPRFWRDPRLRATAIPLLLSLVGLVLSTENYRVLLGFPILQRFRWPFKLFLFFEFFLLLWLTELYSASASRHRAIAYYARVTALSAVLGNLFLAHLFQAHKPTWFQHIMRPSWKVEIPPHPQRYAPVGYPKDLGNSWTGGTHNAATSRGSLTIGGYEPLAPEANIQVGMGLTNITPWISPSELRERSGLRDHLRRWGVSELLVCDNPSSLRRLGGVPDLRRIGWDPETGMHRYQLIGALPVARWEHDPSTSLPILLHSAGATVHLPEGHPGGILVIALVHHPAYRARGDGLALTMAAAEPKMPLELEVPPGVRQVELSYESRSLQLGVWISGLTGLVVLLGLLVPGFLRTRLPTPGSER